MAKLNKKGIELQVNFIVILIITIVIFGASMAIAYKVLNKTKELKGQVDTTTQQRLESLLLTGKEEVAIPFNKIEDAKRGSSQTFALGIQNSLDATKDFYVNVSGSSEIKDNGESISGNYWDNSDWTYSYKIGSGNKQTFVANIKNNDHTIIPIIFLVPKEADIGATYIFNVQVCYRNVGITTGGCTPYPPTSSIKKVRITVTN